MFWQVAKFEARYQSLNPVFWTSGAILFLLTFAGMVAEDIRFGSGANVHENAPSAIAAAHIVLSIFFIFIPAAFVSNVIVRDDETGFGPLIRSTRVRKFDYLIGRFTGAFGAAAIAFLAVPFAIWLGSMAAADPQTIGPNNFSAYAVAYFALALPNIFVASAVFFALATITRSMVGTFLGVIGLLVVYTSIFALMSRLPEGRGVFALFEPFGLAALREVTRYWTTSESNSQTPALSALMLGNRLIWCSIGGALLVLAHATYSFSVRSSASRNGRKQSSGAEEESRLPPRLTAAAVLPKPSFDLLTSRAQLLARTRLEMQQVFKSPAYAILLLLGLVLCVALLSTTGYRYGTPSLSVTRHMIAWLSAPFSFVILIIAVYYSGELVWRDRDRKFHEILDATPLPNWAYLVPKTLAVYLVLLSTLFIGVCAAISMQLVNGDTRPEPGKYLLWYILPESVDMLLISILAVFVHAISRSKYIGWGLLLLLYLIFNVAAAGLGLEHKLYLYGESPEVDPSDMNGLGSYWFGAWVFRLYWAGVAVLMLVGAHLLWSRGTETRLRPRLRRAPARLSGAAGAIGIAAMVVVIGAGSYAFHNTNVLNTYRTSAELDRRSAEREKRFLKYESLPQPLITHVELDVALFPEETRAMTRGRFTITNLTDQAIHDVHVRNPTPDLEILSLEFPGAQLASHDEEFGYRIYTLEQPMAPGEARQLSFETRCWQRGFRNDGEEHRVVANGTFLDARGITPAIGMNRVGLLEDRAKRRKYDLLPELRPAKLEEITATSRNQIGGGWSTADITVSTTADQTPIAPGRKVSDLVENGRRAARFVSDAPILTFFSIQSARYAEKHRQHAGVDLAVYYHPEHHWNVDRMLDALGVALDYCQAAFGPYQFDGARIVEFPAYARFAQAFANTIPYSEAVGFVADVNGGKGIDYVTYVTAHELAHQWWAHQVIGAQMQGSTMLTETLAQYSALMVMKRLYGPNKIRQFLKYELDLYLTGRAREAVEELPLNRVEDQPYIHYQKGSLAMYLLQERLGEDAVNRALRTFVDRYKFKGPPYPRSLDLVAGFREQATTPAQQELITDLFERITLYDFRVQEASAVRREDGRWDITLQVATRKLYASGNGGEQEVPLQDEIEIGLFTAEPGARAFVETNVLAMERRPIHSGEQVLTFVTDTKPTHVGIDPYNFYIDRNSGDNVVRVP